MIFKCFPSLGSLHTQCHLEHRCLVFLQNVPCVTAVASAVLAQYSAADLRPWSWTLRFSSKSSIIIALLHRCFEVNFSLQFEIDFMYDVKEDSNLIHSHIESVLSARFVEKTAIPAKRVLLKSTQIYTGTFNLALQMYIYPYTSLFWLLLLWSKF